MKNRLAIVSLAIVFCSTFATTAVFSQTIYIWTGAADGTNFSTGGNWNPNGVPGASGKQDTAEWNGVTTTNLVIDYGGLGVNSGFGSSGINLALTPNQTNSVDLTSPVTLSSGFPLFAVNLASGAGAFDLGDNSQNVLSLILRPANSGQIHDFVNNSTNAATIYPNVMWTAGGGVAYILDFDGSGNWIVNNSLSSEDNVGSLAQKDGVGTMFWTAANVPNSSGGFPINSPFTINDGTVVLESSGLLSTQAITDNGTLQYNGVAQAQTLSGVISGSGVLEVSASTLTLSGPNTYTNSTVLTNAGTLLVNSVENPGISGPLGIGGVISFGGGTLQFSVSNTFDYSSRFDTSSGQAYSFNTGGLSVTFTNALASTGGTLTKSGPGTLTLAGASSYGGTTTVNGGELVFQGAKSGNGAITVADGAALGVYATATQVTPDTLTVGSSSGATLEFDNVSSLTTAPVAANTLSASGTVTVNVSFSSFTFALGQKFPLLTWTNGSMSPVSLVVVAGAGGYLSISGNTLYLTITSLPLTWTGSNNGFWDTFTTNNWKSGGAPVVFANGDPVLFDDTAPGTTILTVNSKVLPGMMTVNNSVLSYVITSSADNFIGGATGLTKSGSGSLTLTGGGNTYTGVTTIGGGMLIANTLANGGSASDIGAASSTAGNLVLNGGALQYTGAGASIDRMFALGTGGGTIDNEGFSALNLINTGSVGYVGAGERILTLAGIRSATNTLAAILADNGGPTSLLINGGGNWIVTANNTFSGGLTIGVNGTLQIGAGASSGSIGAGSVVNNGGLIADTSSTLTVNAVSGSGAVTQEGTGTLVLPGSNTYSGVTTISSGTLQIGIGGATGSLNTIDNVADNGALIFNSTGAFTLGGVISGIGTLEKRGSGLLLLTGINTYTGGTLIDPGATLEVARGNTGSIVGNVTNNGELLVIRQDNGFAMFPGNITGTGSFVKDNNNPNQGDVTLLGTNTYSGGTTIYGGVIILGDNADPGFGSIVGNVFMTNYSASYPGPSVSTLTFNRPDNYTFSGVISGAGSVLQEGGGTLTLTASNTYTGTNTVNNGALIITTANAAASTMVLGGTLGGSGTFAGPVTMSAGATLSPGNSSGTVTTLTANDGLSLGGNLAVQVNKSMSQSNDLIIVTGTLTNTGTGSVTVQKLGPALAVGDKFTLFGEPLQNGAAMTVTGAGVNWDNHLATDGSISVGSFVASPTLDATPINNGNSLQFSWTGAFKLQAETNGANVGLSNNWADYPGGATYPVTVPIARTNGSVFLRLVPTP